MGITRKEFESGAWSISFEEYMKCYCPECERKDTCIHSGAFRRLPVVEGGLGLCPNLTK